MGRDETGRDGFEAKLERTVDNGADRQTRFVRWPVLDARRVRNVVSKRKEQKSWLSKGGRRNDRAVAHRVSRTNTTNPFECAFSASPRYLALMNTANTARYSWIGVALSWPRWEG